ncbi:MAG TPA: glycosyltransferase family 1 protein [Candidatus Paceibacterota bacterium]|nr:glycosyltransferase family 1 protein [Candidatus Paceibacterota bacterium]
MIIGIDIRILASSSRSGIVEYAEQVIGRMIAAAPEHRFKLFYSSFRRPLPNYEWLSAPNVELHSYRIPNNLLFLANRFFRRPRLDLLIGGVDVFFSPHFFLTALSSSCRRAVVFHDLSYLRFPEFFTLKKKFWHTAMEPQRQAKLADKLITVSESTKADLVRCYALDPARIEVVSSGVDMTRPSKEDLEHFKKEHSLPERYIFSLGTLEPRKNLLGLVRAFNKISQRTEFSDCWLLIAGERGWLDDKVFREISSSPVSKRIRYLGHVSDQERPYYYALASVFAYPSFFEGFGFPILEAMACGVPVVTSNNSSMPEVAGPAAILVDAYSIDDIVSAISELMIDDQLRKEMVARGQQRARLFNWQDCAMKTLDLLVSDSPQR